MNKVAGMDFDGIFYEDVPYTLADRILGSEHTTSKIVRARLMEENLQKIGEFLKNYRLTYIVTGRPESERKITKEQLSRALDAIGGNADVSIDPFMNEFRKTRDKISKEMALGYSVITKVEVIKKYRLNTFVESSATQVEYIREQLIKDRYFLCDVILFKDL